eukprot:TRINITY_DN1270_c0_g1_i4.p1 TRINITY_DN1270_c0_g1~~TRINITY_DN1270_c0_g1_i4.p1  ORF type:complete len:185 (-),score=24.61 TRINITY_DN1270_c0_g1_i4:648-1202(-)
MGTTDAVETQLHRRVLTFVVRSFMDRRWNGRRQAGVVMFAALLLLVVGFTLRQNWTSACDAPIRILLSLEAAVLTLTIIYYGNLMSGQRLFAVASEDEQFENQSQAMRASIISAVWIGTAVVAGLCTFGGIYFTLSARACAKELVGTTIFTTFAGVAVFSTFAIWRVTQCYIVNYLWGPQTLPR